MRNYPSSYDCRSLLAGGDVVVETVLDLFAYLGERAPHDPPVLVVPERVNVVRDDPGAGGGS